MRRSWVVAAAVIRVALVVYGDWHDRNMVVKYTDVDYRVYTDAAQRIWEDGGSPFDRHTYRYSPLIALAMVPNLIIHPAFGKLLFCASDLAVAELIFRLLRARLLDEASAHRYSALWLFNPITINICSRGNADTLACLLVLLVVYLLVVERRLLWSAAALGFSIHMRIFPVVFAPTLLFFIDRDYDPVHHVWAQRLKFVTMSILTFAALGGLFFALYGEQFINEAYLYHLTRVDTRHNFSVFFYWLYLQGADESAARTAGLLAFAPQLLLQAMLGWKFKGDPVFAICLQTMTFVTFNKVCTAQYFAWYIATLPVALPSTTMRVWPVGLVLLLAWLATELHWLYWGYNLEFLGLDAFAGIWAAGLAFFCANVSVLFTLLRGYKGPLQVFRGGVLLPYSTKSKHE